MRLLRGLIRILTFPFWLLFALGVVAWGFAFGKSAPVEAESKASTNTADYPKFTVVEMKNGQVSRVRRMNDCERIAAVQADFERTPGLFIPVSKQEKR